ncbi:MAG TPA: glutamate-5-semialdehyde dehydrogenase [Rectinemataceae bacterium]|nr:glutamate-5-semialdehyde dehydrogenase [Rectinemataceae bacterium]
MTTQKRVALGAQAAAAILGIGSETKNAALDLIAKRLEEARAEIEKANGRDIEAAEKAGLPKPILKRLAFGEDKFADALAGISALRRLPDPCGRVLEARLLDEGLTLRRVSCPIGLIAMIFESRPDALVQMACLAAKSGNAIVLKGGSEARESNRILAAVIAAAGEEAGLPERWLTALETREQTSDLLALDQYVDLVIPRGSKEFVAHIKATSRIPVLGHSDGVCHVYIHEDADPDMAAAITIDSKTQYPAACNAAEVLLVHAAYAERGLAPLLSALARSGVALDLCPRCAAMVTAADIAWNLKADEDWSVEYLDMRMAVKIVDSLDEAIAHINRYGSGHTDTIVSGVAGLDGDAGVSAGRASAGAARRFMTGVDSASVYHNASTRFADGYRYGLGAEVGISTGKLHARGPMGLEGLLTYKWLLEGSGQIVADYASGTRSFLHKDLPLDTGNQR